jgi:hypothetical protein
MNALLELKPDDLVGAPMFIPDDWLSSLPAGWNPVANRNDPLVWVASLPGMVDSGRFAACVAPLDACVLNGQEQPGRCISPRMLMRGDDLSFANVSTITAASGSTVKGARIAGGMPHAPLDVDPFGAQDYYANTGTGWARGVYIVDYERGGVFVAGALDPHTTIWQALAMQASALSGDWRWVEELRDYRFIASQGVNVPGYRPALAASVGPGRYAAKYPTLATVRASLTQSPTAALMTWETIEMCKCEEALTAAVADNADGDGNPVNPAMDAGTVYVEPGPSLRDIEALNGRLDEALERIGSLTETVALLVAENRQLRELPEKPHSCGDGCDCRSAEMNLIEMAECC